MARQEANAAALTLARRGERSRLLASGYGVWHFARRKPLGALGGLICLVLLVLAILAPLLAPYPYDEIHAADRLQNPSLRYWLGTDNLGRDMLSRIIYGARITLIVGFGAVAIAVAVSIVVGVASGYFGRWLDMAVQRVVDIWMSFPTIILAVSLIAITQPGVTPVMVVLGVIWAARGVRIVRGAVLSLKENPYIEAARVVGCTDLAILARHLLPNVLPVVVVFATIQIGAVILAEASISFLGYGIPPPFPSWGQMLSGSALRFLEQHPVMAVWPGLAIMLVVFGFNVFGDALRDVWDPRLRGGR